MSLVQDLKSEVAWRRREAEAKVTQLTTDAYLQEGVLRWKNNDRVPPADILELAQEVRLAGFNLEASAQARSAELDAFVAVYRKTRQSPTAEERAEARAAHGPGVELVDVLSGHRYRT